MKERMALQKTKRKKTQFSKNASNFISTFTEMDEVNNNIIYLNVKKK